MQIIAKGRIRKTMTNNAPAIRRNVVLGRGECCVSSRPGLSIPIIVYFVYFV